jgi:hypothetical protein
MTDSASEHSGLGARAAVELKRYVLISAYLFVCFAVVMIYESTQSTSSQASWVVLGVAAIKALVIGKFILIGEALKPGTRMGAPTLLHRVAWRSLGLLVVLVLLKLIEELVVGLADGKPVSNIVGGLADRDPVALLAPVLLMLLILIPLVTATEIDRALGKAGLAGLLLGREG